MKIVFWGQKGFSKILTEKPTQREQRVAILSTHLTQEGNNVTVFTTTAYAGGSHYRDVRVKKLASLDPCHPGGITYLVLGLIYILKS